ncbi:hypothetical protein PINS_up001562 [Pythium insidiosum]|nr:hypothetical protein PINS_up001562 [Pythium insidiosum]
MIYVPYLIQGREPSRVLVQLMNFMITCKGYFDFVVWFQMNEFNDTCVTANIWLVDIVLTISLFLYGQCCQDHWEEGG